MLNELVSRSELVFTTHAHRTNFQSKSQRNEPSNLSTRGERARKTLHLTQFSAIPSQPFLRKVAKTTKNGVFGHFFKIIRTILAFKTTFKFTGHLRGTYLQAERWKNSFKIEKNWFQKLMFFAKNGHMTYFGKNNSFSI